MLLNFPQQVRKTFYCQHLVHFQLGCSCLVPQQTFLAKSLLQPVLLGYLNLLDTFQSLTFLAQALHQFYQAKHFQLIYKTWCFGQALAPVSLSYWQDLLIFELNQKMKRQVQTPLLE